MLLCLCGLIILPASLPAQSRDEWTVLQNRPAGEPLSVTDRNARITKGLFRTWRAEDLAIDVRGAETRFLKEDVTRVQSRTQARRLRNAIIGGVAGLGVGLVLYYTVGTYLRNEGQEEAIQSLLVIAPIAGGVGLGAAVPSYPTIYRAPRR